MNQVADFFSKLFDHSDWTPRWQYGSWSSFHGWLYIIGALLTLSAFFSIPIIIVKYLKKKTTISLDQSAKLLTVFLVACGVVFLLDVIAFWLPMYRLHALMIFITGIVSWLTIFNATRFLSKLSLQKNKETDVININDEQVKAVFKNAPDAIAVFDKDGIIKNWNPAAENMFGFSMHEMTGQKIQDKIVPAGLRERHEQILQKISAREKNTAPLCQPALRKNETAIDIELSISPINVNKEALFIAFIRDVTTSKKAAEALKESEERYRLLTSEVYDYAIIMLSPDGKINSWNEGAQRITGYNEQESIGRHFSILYPDEAISEQLPVKELAIARDESRFEDESWRVKKDGSRFWATSVITALRSNGNIIGYSSITRDITRRKQAEEEIRLLNAQLEKKVEERTKALEESELKYRKLFENSPLPMWVIDINDFHFIDVNEASINHYGYSREEFLSMTAMDIRPREEKERFINYNRPEGRGSVNNGSWKHVKKDGAVIDVLIRSHELNIGNSKARIVLSVDITDRQKAEERLDMALEAGNIGIWELDLQQKTSVRNFRHDQIFGYTTPVVDWSLDDLFAHIHPDDVIACKDVFYNTSNTKPLKVECRIVLPGGVIRWVTLTAKTVAEKNGRSHKLFGTIVDITEFKNVEEQILALNNELEERVAQRTGELDTVNKELESFTYSVSHDLRAPLRAIHGYSQILNETYEGKIDGDGERMLARIMTNTKKMGHLIDDLLVFSRLGRAPVKKELISLDALLQEVLADINQNNHYPHEIIIGRLGEAMADRTVLKQVFHNLLLNAYKYSGKVASPVIEIGQTTTQKGKTYFVKDNGAGFDMAYYHKLFGVFQRLHRQDEFEGTGVGLAIVQKIIRKHGGAIWAEATIDQGATFYFTI